MSPLQKITRTKNTITQTKNTITQSWTYRHPQAIAILTLITVIMVQNTTTLQQNALESITGTLANLLPNTTLTASNPNSYSNNPPNPTDLINCDYKCLTTAWVDLRTDELYNEQEAATLKNLRHNARIQALTEANDQFKDIIHATKNNN